MTTTHRSQAVSALVPPSCQCFPAEGAGVQVRTPWLYPDGDVVDVFVRERDGGYLVTDYGDGLGWFRSQSIVDRFSPEQQRQIDDLCAALGVEMSRGQLRLHCPADNLAESVDRLAQAVVQVAELLIAPSNESPSARLR